MHTGRPLRIIIGPEITSTINPRHACAVRVTVLGLCVCLCHHAQQCTQQDIPAASAGHEQSSKNGVFFKNAWFRSYAVICLPRQRPALLQRPLASFSDDRGFGLRTIQCKAASYFLSQLLSKFPLTHACAWVPGWAGRIMLHTRVYFSRMCYQIVPRVLHFSAFIM